MSYLNARYYDGARGQFTSQDPVFRAIGNEGEIKQKTGLGLQELLADPQQLNSYSYARNNPLIFKDPSGLFNLKTGAVEKGDTLKSITGALNKANGTNYGVGTIQRLNSIQDRNKISVGQILIPNESVPDITSSLKSTAQENAKDSSINSKLTGPKNFYDKVKTGGPWDFKNDPNSPYYSANYSDGFVFGGEKVPSDFPGNFNFGYTGNSTWWGGQTVLLGGAGAAQVISNSRSGSPQNWGTPFMDSPGDTEQIMQGILYRQGGY